MKQAQQDFVSELLQHGIDIAHPLDVHWYNAHVAIQRLQSQLNWLPDYGRQDGALAFVLGNSRALWPKFISWLSLQPDPDMADPLEKYTESVIRSAVAKLTSAEGGAPIQHDIFWSWDRGDRLVSMQRVAVASALCYHDSETQLAIHPRFGAWVAFRAVVVMDAPALTAEAPAGLPCLLTQDEKAAAHEAMAAALRASDEANLCTQLHGSKGMDREVCRAWVALRDCVGIGKDQRYSDDQLAYHYTKDRAALQRAIAALQS